MVELKVSRITADFIVLALCAIPLLIFHKWVEPYKRGFYCDDESIRYPYRPSTVSRQMLVVVGLIVPAILIVTTETFRVLVWERKCRNEFLYYRCRQYTVPRLIVRLYVFFGYFLVGVIFNQLMVDIAKYTIGRHRPHFIAVCKPKDFETCPANSHEYITDFECTGTDKYLIHESMLSFYSGHSAFSFYAAWYTAALFIAEVFSRREIPSCDAHYCNREFGLASQLEHAVPLSDMEAGVRSDNGAQLITAHNVTVTGVMAPNINELMNNDPSLRQTPRKQRFPSAMSLQSSSITASYYSTRGDLESLISSSTFTSLDYYSVLSQPIMQFEVI